MKKLLSIFVVSILLLGSSFAQVKISGGVLGGLNLANLSFDPEPTGVSIDNLTGFGAGGVLNFEFVGGFNIQAEPMYLQTGAKTTASGVDVKLKINYISIPVLFIYTFQTGVNQVQPYIFAGPSLGFTASATLNVSAGGLSVDYDMKDSVKTTDFSGVFGAGVNIPVGMNTVFIEGRYSLGFTDINNTTTSLVGNGSSVTVKTKGIQFFAGIRFPFGS